MRSMRWDEVVAGLLGMVLFVAIVPLACGANDTDDPESTMKSLESAEHAYQERVGQQAVAYMSLETMFPDSRARALAKAAGNGKLAEVDRLVAEGVDVNSRGTQNATPLFWSMRNLSGFERLLELGADPNILFGDGSTVMHWAARADDPAFIEAALQHGGDPNLVARSSKETPLASAIGMVKSEANDEVIDALLDAGANIDALNDNGDTPAMTAAGFARFDLVYKLLMRGASYSIRNKSGKTLVDRVAGFRGGLEPGSEWAAWYDRVVAWLNEQGVEVSS
jgi:ankyrin repeat protein